MKKFKTSFAKVGAYSSEENFIRRDSEGVVEWISGEAEAFEEILSNRRDICAFSGARGIIANLEKAGCDHVKAIAHTEAAFSTDDMKDPSAEATLIGGKFYSNVWVNDGRELASEIIKKNEKDTYDARVEAKQAEEAAKRERRIGNVFCYFWLRYLLCGFELISLPTSAELCPTLEPYNPLADPEMKEALDIVGVANFIIDEVVDKLLNKVAEKVLREE
jgi:hypothetical protein